MANIIGSNQSDGQRGRFADVDSDKSQVSKWFENAIPSSSAGD